MADDDISHFLKEWEATRDVLKTFDNHLHDLRKYGFSFITALLTASTILFEGEPFTEHIKATILGVTLLLIIGIFTIDIYYRFFQRSANIRSCVLEKVLNIELSDTITQRYRSSLYTQYVVSGVYGIFIVGVLGLGIAVLSNSLFWLSLMALVSLLLLVALSKGWFFLHYEYGWMDWILDRLECKGGDEVRIIMTNIGDNPVPIPAGEVMWKLFKEGENIPLRSGVAPPNLKLESFHNYMWELKTKGDEKGGEKPLESGIYRIEVRPLQKNSYAPKPKGKMRPLSRKLRIKPSGEPPVHHVKLIKNTK